MENKDAKFELRDGREKPLELRMADELMERGIDSLEKLQELFEPHYFAVVPMDVLERKDLNANAKLLYGEITGLTKRSGYCNATDKYIAERIGLSKKSIQKLMQELAEKDLISRETSKTSKGTYRRIYLTWRRVPVPPESGTRTPAEGHPVPPFSDTPSSEQRHPVPPADGTKGEIDKKKSDQEINTYAKASKLAVDKKNEAEKLPTNYLLRAFDRYIKEFRNAKAQFERFKDGRLIKHALRHLSLFQLEMLLVWFAREKKNMQPRIGAALCKEVIAEFINESYRRDGFYGQLESIALRFSERPQPKAQDESSAQNAMLEALKKLKESFGMPFGRT